MNREIKTFGDIDIEICKHVKVKPSGTILPKISEYAKGFDGTK